MGEPARDLLGRPIPAGHMVDDDHTAVRAGPRGTRHVRVDPVAAVAVDVDGLGEQRLVGHGRLLDIRASAGGAPAPRRPAARTALYRGTGVCLPVSCGVVPSS